MRVEFPANWYQDAFPALKPGIGFPDSDYGSRLHRFLFPRPEVPTWQDEQALGLGAWYVGFEDWFDRFNRPVTFGGFASLADVCFAEQGLVDSGYVRDEEGDLIPKQRAARSATFGAWRGKR